MRTKTAANPLATLLAASASAQTAVRFELADAFPEPAAALAVVAADLDADGDPDLLIGLADSAIELRFNLGPASPGAFAPPRSLPVGVGDTRAIAVADVNLDGIPDILDAHSFSPFSRDSGVNIRFGRPAPNLGEFSPPVHYALPDAWPGAGIESIRTADVNADGLPDILITVLSASAVGILLNTPGPAVGAFQPYRWVDAGAYDPAGLALADVNADGAADLIVTSLDGEAAYIVPAIPDRPAAFAAPAPIHGGFVSFDLVVEDFNVDGEPDLAFSDATRGEVSVWTGDAGRGAAGFTRSSASTARPGAFRMARADFDGDGAPDLAVANYDGRSLTILPRRPSAAPPFYRSPLHIDVGRFPFGVAAADFDLDGRPDLAVTSADRPGRLIILRNRSCAPDISNDGALDLDDYELFVRCFEGHACAPGRSADFNNDGFTDFFDYDAFVAAFEAGC